MMLKLQEEEREALYLKPLTGSTKVYPLHATHGAIYYAYSYCMLGMKELRCQLCWFHLWIMAQCAQYEKCTDHSSSQTSHDHNQRNSNGVSGVSADLGSGQLCSFHQSLSSERVAYGKMHTLSFCSQESYGAQVSLHDSFDSTSFLFLIFPLYDLSDTVYRISCTENENHFYYQLSHEKTQPSQEAHAHTVQCIVLQDHHSERIGDRVESEDTLDVLDDVFLPSQRNTLCDVLHNIPCTEHAHHTYQSSVWKRTQQLQEVYDRMILYTAYIHLEEELALASFEEGSYIPYTEDEDIFPDDEKTQELRVRDAHMGQCIALEGCLDVKYPYVRSNLSCVTPWAVATCAGASSYSILGSQKSYYYLQRST
jgi:hypothetical protein